MKTSLWRGSKEIAESPESPKWDFQTDKNVCVRTFYGPYASCLARKPTNGQKMADLGSDSGLQVVNVKVNKQKGGKGEMIVTLEEGYTYTSVSTSQPPKYEIEWVQTDRKLESHDRYSELTDEEFALVQQALDAQNKAERDIALTDDAFGDLMFELYEKKRKGQDAFTLYSPVLRRTTIWTGAHKATPCGVRMEAAELPAVLQTMAPDGYVWMKTADRGTQSGRFGKHERIEEWSGFDSIDADIYK
jgi:hypothetical protein